MADLITTPRLPDGKTELETEAPAVPDTPASRPFTTAQMLQNIESTVAKHMPTAHPILTQPLGQRIARAVMRCAEYAFKIADANPPKWRRGSGGGTGGTETTRTTKGDATGEIVL